MKGLLDNDLRNENIWGLKYFENKNQLLKAESRNNPTIIDRAIDQNNKLFRLNQVLDNSTQAFNIGYLQKFKKANKTVQKQPQLTNQ